MKRYSPWILEAWATWELLRQLGYASDDIAWEFVPTLNALPKPGLALNVVLRTQGKSFVVTCSQRLTEAEARDLKRDATDMQVRIMAEEFAEAEMTEVFRASYAWTRKAALLVALSAKGFALPCEADIAARRDRRPS